MLNKEIICLNSSITFPSLVIEYKKNCEDLVPTLQSKSIIIYNIIYVD